ncbi:MAG: DEAD/DEAH box helicase [Chloroflexaceae bacterium]|nr:DEAD/DEAH box helicase [Chloroflexaceae bacterium]
MLEVIEHELPKLQKMSGFQRRTLEAILKAVEFDTQRAHERGVVVTASTGAGKTYAFFLPVLAKIVLERCLRGQIGVKAICIYPRVALSENQLTDFIEILFYLNHVLARHQLPLLTIGIESGAAVYQQSDFQKQERLSRRRGWKFNNAEQGYESPFAYCVGTTGHNCENTAQRLLVRSTQPSLLICPACGKSYPFIQFARDVMVQHPPDILIATTESLNRRLLSSKYQYLFGTHQFCAPSVVMLDEIHLQTSTAGTQVALLLRRLLARIRLGKQERGDRANLAFVGLSATIAQPVQFLAELGGLLVTRISEVKPHDDEMQVIGAEQYLFVRAEESEDTAVISTLIQTAMCILHTMAQPPQGSDLSRYRTFGFVQSLDVVGRWLYQMQDAERVRDYQTQRREEYQRNHTPIQDRDIRYIPLYAYRLPPHNRQLFPEFFGPNTDTTCDCEHRTGPDLDCPFFQAGECWWVLSPKGKARREPLTSNAKTGK